MWKIDSTRSAVIVAIWNLVGFYVYKKKTVFGNFEIFRSPGIIAIWNPVRSLEQVESYKPICERALYVEGLRRYRRLKN